MSNSTNNIPLWKLLPFEFYIFIVGLPFLVLSVLTNESGMLWFIPFPFMFIGLVVMTFAVISIFTNQFEMLTKHFQISGRMK